MKQPNLLVNAQQILFRMRSVSRKRGLWYVARTAVARACQFAWRKTFCAGRTFQFRGKSYRYFLRLYNQGWATERVVEIPVAQAAMEQFRGKRILEVGNVMSHYFPARHDILDKYEKDKGVINEDVVDFHPADRYDLIISISTMEHVGWDEDPRDGTKTLRAVEHLKTCLAPGGTLLVTVPLGYNHDMDRMLKDGNFGFTEIHCLERVSKDNRWVEADWNNVRQKNWQYNEPFPAANVVVAGEFHNR